MYTVVVVVYSEYTCTSCMYINFVYASVIAVYQERYYMYMDMIVQLTEIIIFLCIIRIFPSSEEFSLLNAAFQIIRGGVIPLNIATVQTGDGGKCYMSLLANWGLVADIDIESEKFRKIGETRFFLGMKPWPDTY